jgi:hypothetical protein
MALVSRLALLMLASCIARGQYVLSTRAGIIHFVEGEAFIDGKPAQWTPLRFPLLAPGQVLTTGNGRAEVLLGPGVFLRLDRHAAIRMIDGSLEDTQIQIQQGAALVEVIEIPKGNNVHVAVGPVRTSFKGIGLHRFDATSRQLRVFGGDAAVVADEAHVEASRGKLIHLDNSLSASKFSPRRKDDLLLWSANRSFQLYLSNLDAHARTTNWEITKVMPAGTARLNITSDRDRAYYYNRDFGVMFYSHAWALNNSLRTPAPATRQ